MVGPEAPLVAGVVDRLPHRWHAHRRPGPGAARLEGSKVICKELFHAKRKIPTADYVTVDHPTEARHARSTVSAIPVVLKADGLAAGKGVVVAQDRAEAERRSASS